MLIIVQYKLIFLVYVQLHLRMLRSTIVATALPVISRLQTSQQKSRMEDQIFISSFPNIRRILQRFRKIGTNIPTSHINTLIDLTYLPVLIRYFCEHPTARLRASCLVCKHNGGAWGTSTIRLHGQPLVDVIPEAITEHKKVQEF